MCGSLIKMYSKPLLKRAFKVIDYPPASSQCPVQNNLVVTMVTVGQVFIKLVHTYTASVT